MLCSSLRDQVNTFQCPLGGLPELFAIAYIQIALLKKMQGKIRAKKVNIVVSLGYCQIVYTKKVIMLNLMKGSRFPIKVYKEI